MASWSNWRRAVALALGGKSARGIEVVANDAAYAPDFPRSHLQALAQRGLQIALQKRELKVARDRRERRTYLVG